VRRSTYVTLAGLTIACAASQAHAQATPGDPWEKMNRRGFAIHQTLDRILIGPIAAIYHALTPGPIGRGLHNMLTNLGRFRRADISALRFVFNSTIGIGGLFDVIAHIDSSAAHQENSFGVTLGRWGVKPGPYLFIPLLGPSTVRDLIGGGVDASADPFHWVHYPGRTELTTSGAIVGGIELRSRTGPALATLLSGAADPYATLRSVYLQNRQAQVDGSEAQPLTDLPDIEDAPPPPSSQSPATPDQAAPPPSPPAAEPAPVAPPPAAPPPPTPGPQSSSEVIRSAGGRYV
jgi:phospholipid-binding lipoprotein MlaA